MPAKLKRINIRVKGANAERDIATHLNAIIYKTMEELNYSNVEMNNANFFVQRNQNQSAVGGKDLTNTYGFAIEVKRQEALSINTWWNQCLIAAREANEIPVLLFKQNGKKWRCITETYFPLSGDKLGRIRGEIDFDTFLQIFKNYVVFKLQ